MATKKRDAQKIRDVMTMKLVTLEAGTPVAEAARAMRDHDVGDVLVMQKDALLGILTDRDIAVRCVAQQNDPGQTSVESICSKQLATLSPDDKADVAVRLMAKKAIRRIPVLEDGKPCGIVSLGDLAEERDRASALGSISAAPANA